MQRIRKDYKEQSRYNPYSQVRPHVGLGKRQTPAMGMGLYHRRISILELLSLQGVSSLTPSLTNALTANLEQPMFWCTIDGEILYTIAVP